MPDSSPGNRFIPFRKNDLIEMGLRQGPLPVAQAPEVRELARLWLDQNKNQSAAVSLLKRAESLDPGNEETKSLMERAKGK